MAKKTIEIEGQVRQNLPDAKFRVELEDGRLILAHLSGKMRIYHIRVMPGDWVRVAMTPYDDQRGRIIRRLKEKGEKDESKTQH